MEGGGLVPPFFSYMNILSRFEQLFIAIDQTAGCVVGLFLKNGAWADESLSARAWREGDRSKGWRKFRKIVDNIFFWQTGHCQAAYENEKLRSHFPPEYRLTRDT